VPQWIAIRTNDLSHCAFSCCSLVFWLRSQESLNDNKKKKKSYAFAPHLLQNAASASRGVPHDAQNFAFGIDEEAGGGVEAIMGCPATLDDAGLVVVDPDGTFSLMMAMLLTIDKMENTIIKAMNASTTMRITKSAMYNGLIGMVTAASTIFSIVFPILVARSMIIAALSPRVAIPKIKAIIRFSFPLFFPMITKTSMQTV
jgi:hypothetical protein